jgi:hypothetical protein
MDQTELLAALPETLEQSVIETIDPVDPDSSEYLPTPLFTSSADPRSDEEDLTESVDVTIPGFHDLSYLYATTEERLYTLVGSDPTGTLKRLRFASPQHGRARLRLLHELNVVKVFTDFDVPHILQPERVEFFADRGICAVYTFRPVRTFQEYLDEITRMDWEARLGEILKFAKSLARTLSEAHSAGIFRMLLGFC